MTRHAQCDGSHRAQKVRGSAFHHMRVARVSLRWAFSITQVRYTDEAMAAPESKRDGSSASDPVKYCIGPNTFDIDDILAACFVTQHSPVTPEQRQDESRLKVFAALFDGPKTLHELKTHGEPIEGILGDATMNGLVCTVDDSEARAVRRVKIDKFTRANTPKLVPEVVTAYTQGKHSVADIAAFLNMSPDSTELRLGVGAAVAIGVIAPHREL